MKTKRGTTQIPGDVSWRSIRATTVPQRCISFWAAEKARKELGRASSTSLEEMAREMVTHNLEEAREDVVVENQRTD